MHGCSRHRRRSRLVEVAVDDLPGPPEQRHVAADGWAAEPDGRGRARSAAVTWSKLIRRVGRHR